MFKKTKNDSHGSTAKSAKVKNVFKISVNDEEKDFRVKAKEIGNVKELWHGTRVANILSILKSGLLMPKLSPGQTTGYMFGQGLYFSDQSTKSLNYCDGMYWAGGSKSNSIFMFLAEVAMGKEYVPSSSTSQNPPKGYDSYFAKANQSGVRNNEMIVFDTKQIYLKYILEIEVR